MVNGLFTRGAIATAVFVGGLHFTGLMCFITDNFRNPAWRFLAPLFSFEWTLIRLLLWVTGVVVVLLVGQLIMQFIGLVSGDFSPQPSHHYTDAASTDWFQTSVKSDGASLPPRPQYQAATKSTRFNNAPVVPEPEPHRAMPSPEQIKQQAIEQITKGW